MATKMKKAKSAKAEARPSPEEMAQRIAARLHSGFNPVAVFISEGLLSDADVINYIKGRFAGVPVPARAKEA